MSNRPAFFDLLRSEYSDTFAASICLSLVCMKTIGFTRPGLMFEVLDQSLLEKLAEAAFDHPIHLRGPGK